MDNSQEMTTPLNRFFTFWWILAGFAAFGLLALVAFVLGGGRDHDTAYQKRSAERLATKEKIVAAQEGQLGEVKIDLAAGAAALSASPAAASTAAVPGTPTHDKILAEIKKKADAEAASKAVEGGQTLTISATNSAKLAPGEMPLQFVEKELTAVAGGPIVLTFNNPDALQHNWVLCKVGTLDAVAALAMGMMAKDAAGAMASGFIPETDDILAYSKLLNLGESDTFQFTAPAEPGDYPYLCTFPGHIMMRGVLKITAK